ncbi:DUF421 domain-containing protein [Citricoccus sp. GCM10030269]|uniref:DUF421 domain-containing protein n=1 Tax=Citricoccus sp. GCM10030269 TaxID=3273388 RepID=UPI00360FC47B
MDAILYTAGVYIVLILLVRLTGKRTLAQVTTMDFIVLLIIGEATQQVLLGQDYSLTQVALVVGTLLGLERLSDYLGWRFPRFGALTDSIPLVLVQDGELLHKAMAKEQISKEDILSAARSSQGLERMDQIKWAVLETTGSISVVPKSNALPQV